MTHLTINVLGSFQVSLDGKPIQALESVKVRALLAYLAVESSTAHHRGTLVGLLWPEFTETSARHNLRQALFNLRSNLGEQNTHASYLIITRDTIQFNRDSDYSLDFDQFNQHYRACEGKLHQLIEDSPALASDLEEMIKLYRGEFLQHFFLEDSSEFEQWAMVQRENSHQRALEAHSYLANYYELCGDFQTARKHASDQLELDPWREEAHRQLIRVLALGGERSAALAQYETCRQVLAEELDVEPSTETRELYEQIRLGTLKTKTSQPSNVPITPVKNLPVQLTPFIGRESERSQLSGLIGDPACRFITLVGPGGIGKTRLAVQVAEEHHKEFTHGAAFIPLNAVGSSVGVIPAIVNAVNVDFYGASDPKKQLLSYLSERQMLLVLDNLEHLLTTNDQQDDITELIVDILREAPGIMLLVTSREALNLQGEWLFELQGMDFPESARAEGFDEFDAVALFAQRARRALPNFTLSEENRDQVARICRLVEGMPLAIELATTWMRTLSLAEIAAEIEKNLDFLSATMRDLPERHRSMRAVFDYSWRMLSGEEQKVLSKLSVFRGGFQRQAAEQVADATLSILSTLVNRTLLRVTSTGRYDLHELVRQYSADQLDADPTAKSEALNQHCDFFLSLAEEANKLLQGRTQLEWLTRLEQEQGNMRRALECTVESCSVESVCSELALKLSAALRWFWRMRGHFHEGCDWLARALKRFPEGRSANRANALLGYSLLLNGLGDLGAARPPAEESVSIFRELGNDQGLAEALMINGLTLLWQGEAASGEELTKEALQIYRRIGDRWGEAQILYRLGGHLADYGGAEDGRRMLEESAAILESFEEKYLYTSVLIALGIVDMKLGNYPAAQRRFESGLAASREIKHPWGMADVLTNMGCLYRIKGDFIKAQSFFDQALKVYQEHGRNVWETDVICAMTENEIIQENFRAAHSHLQTAINLLGTSENKILQILVWYIRGLLAYYEGDTAQAIRWLEETVKHSHEGQFKPDLARALVYLGYAKLKQGEVASAIGLMREGLGVYSDICHRLGYAIGMEALAYAFIAQGDERQAVRLLSSAEALRKEMGVPLTPVDSGRHSSSMATLRAYLGEEVFTELWDSATSHPIQEVVDKVLAKG